MPYTTGLHELGDSCFAYLQPDGGWGWSNAGLVVGDGASILVDTLFDLRLTRSMLDSMLAVTAPAPIATLVNTHANGDHCYGNQLVDVPEIVASAATAHEMTEVPPAMLAAPIVWAGPLSNWVAACDLMLAMDIDTVVPGHGPITDKTGIAAVRDYLAFVDAAAAQRHANGIDAWEAVRDIAREVGASPEFGGWGEFGRIAVNVDTAYRSLDPSYVTPNFVEQFRRMAEIEGATGR